MSRNSVTDAITGQETAFAHLALSGTMNDREAAGLDQHRAAVSEELSDHEAEGTPPLHPGRDQILARLWELANLSPEETRGSISGQIKAMTMIATIQGLLPGRINNRQRSPAPAQLAPPAAKAQMYVSEAMRRGPAAGSQPGESVTAVEAQPTPPPLPEPPGNPANHVSTANQDHGDTAQQDPSPYPNGVIAVPNGVGLGLDAYSSTTSPLRPPFAPPKRRFGPGR
jgi:hypothetical protein